MHNERSPKSGGYSYTLGVGLRVVVERTDGPLAALGGGGRPVVEERVVSRAAGTCDLLTAVWKLPALHERGIQGGGRERLASPPGQV